MKHSSKLVSSLNHWKIALDNVLKRENVYHNQKHENEYEEIGLQELSNVKTLPTEDSNNYH